MRGFRPSRNWGGRESIVVAKLQPTPSPQARATHAASTGPRLRALVAFGPTREPLDDVRFIGNRSSGRMGCAVAEALAERGCVVTAAVGPGAQAPKNAERTERFESAASLLSLLRTEWPAHDLLVMAAAVADFRPAAPVSGKLRRDRGAFTLALEPTEDILSGLSATTTAKQYVVGFALEHPEELEASAAAKLARKRADAIVANPLETMDAPTVRGRVLMADGSWHVPPDATPWPKERFAAWLVDLLLPAVRARCG